MTRPEILAGWAQVGRFADELLASERLTKEDEASIRLIRHGAAVLVREFDERLFPDECMIPGHADVEDGGAPLPEGVG